MHITKMKLTQEHEMEVDKLLTLKKQLEKKVGNNMNYKINKAVFHCFIVALISFLYFFVYLSTVIFSI